VSWRVLALLALATSAQGLTVKPAGWLDMMNEWMSPSASAVMTDGAGGNLKGDNEGDPAMFGVFADGGFGFDSGLILSTGSVLTAAKTAHADTDADDFGPALEAGDRATLTANFTANTATNLYFDYVFASRELPEFGGLGSNDLFYISINNKNVSLLSDGTEATINNLVPAGTKGGRDATKDHPDYIDNPLQKFFPYTGYTKVLKATGTTIVGSNSLVVCVKDEDDGNIDSALFLKSKGLVIEGFSWIADDGRGGQWGACDCAKGVQSRSFTCMDANGKVAPTTGDVKCGLTKEYLASGGHKLDEITPSKATFYQDCSAGCVCDDAPQDDLNAYWKILRVSVLTSIDAGEFTAEEIPLARAIATVPQGTTCAEAKRETGSSGIFEALLCQTGEPSIDDHLCKKTCGKCGGGDGVYKATPCTVHPLGGAVVILEGQGFGRPGDPDPVVYIGPDTRQLYTHPQYTRRLSDTRIEIGAPITGWGQSGAMQMKVRVQVGSKSLESKLGVLTFSCECANCGATGRQASTRRARRAIDTTALRTAWLQRSLM